MEKVAEFTNQMNADIAIVGTISGHVNRNAYTNNSLYETLSNVRLAGFVFDIHSKQLYSLKHSDDYGGPGRMLPDFVCSLIVNFEQGKLKPIKY